MGDYFETIVDVEADKGEAAALGTLLLDRLIADGIIAAEPTDCVLGAPTGHAPGPNYERAVTRPDPDLASLWTCGVHTEVGRQVFHGMQNTPLAMTCPGCGRVDRLVDEQWQSTLRWVQLGGVLDAWHSENGDGTLDCLGCERNFGLNDWHWSGGSPMALAHLGLTFWNWPPLTEGFVAEVGEWLGGHRVVVTGGKL